MTQDPPLSGDYGVASTRITRNPVICLISPRGLNETDVGFHLFLVDYDIL